MLTLLDRASGVWCGPARGLLDLWVGAQREDPLALLDEESRRWVSAELDRLGRRFVLEDFEPQDLP